MAKLDLDSAYCLLHWYARCAILCITIVEIIAYILMRQYFGIASGPNELCLISELLVDYTTALMGDETWNPDSLHNPNEDIPFNIDYEDPSIEIERFKEILHVVIDTKQSYIDGYIDDLLTMIIEKVKLIKKGIHVIPLICFILFRPVH